MTDAAIPQRSAWQQVLALVGFLLLSLMVEGLVSQVAQPGIAGGWYQSLAKPGWAPPDAWFPYVWTALYVLMGLASFLAWRAAPRGAFGWPFACFLVQLAINAGWPFLFFGAGQLVAALLVIVGLLLAIVATVLAFRPLSGWAALLLLPYLAWTGYATAVTYAILRLNLGA